MTQGVIKGLCLIGREPPKQARARGQVEQYKSIVRLDIA
jgi:hypothetical protein